MSSSSSSSAPPLAVSASEPSHTPNSSDDDDVLPMKHKKDQAMAVSADVTRRMICGGLAGMVAKVAAEESSHHGWSMRTATNPLERIKMLAQTGEHGGGGAAGQAGGILGVYRNILRQEGVWGLWAGNGVNLLRVFPAKALVFSSNDFYQKGWRWLSHTPADQALSTAGSFAAGGLAGMTATAGTYPLDLARGRIAGKLATRPGQKVYKGMISTLVVTVRDEGFLALYRGVTPTLLGAIPYEGIKFGTVGLLEKLFPTRDESGLSTSSSSPQKEKKSSPLRKMLFGGLGGVMAGLITYPNDTVRRLLQLQGSRGTTVQYRGYWDCVAQTYRAHGLGRFYHGLTINLIRMAPNAAVQFGSYELLKQWTAHWV